ncbi:motility associated factor glycosyltransferase family protein [Campylobacter sp. CCS1377]|uniref:Motility associated factor glycosyltransferase family protein n=1 Tax=Campylobacter sp. CCS1377 TaxID=3158229 RepID=A0AAU7E8Y9_9BACT
MAFTEEQKKYYKKNFNALADTLILKQDLAKLSKSKKFKIIQGQDPLDVNLINTYTRKKIYSDPLMELNSLLATYNEKYALYPILYFYGLGNGVLYKALCQNPKLQHIIIFESDIELIFTSLHLIDLSSEIKDRKINIISPKNNRQQILSIFYNQPFLNFVRVYFLELHSDYYESEHDEIIKLNKDIYHTIKEAVCAHGNDPKDALQGIEQFVYNLPKMLTHPNAKELVNTRKELGKNAIIVSTGPSLTKQLPLLKEYANKATIFCADSSYPILAKAGIKPDYVMMLERTHVTAEFFNHDFGDFDKDIIFITTALVHPKAIEYLEKYNRTYILIEKFLGFESYMEFHSFGYLMMVSSVAHMAYELAMALRCENIIFIGQDLAYAKDGCSHPKDYQNSSTYETNMYEHITTKAYGGEGEVETHFIWNMFRTILEKHILGTPKTTKIYNCTEGGARIEGTIEKPFKEICENLLNVDLNKPFPSLKFPNQNKQNERMLKAYYKIQKSIKNCDKLELFVLEKQQNILKKINQEEFKNLSYENKELAGSVIEDIDVLKSEIEKIHTIYGDLNEILQPLYHQFELNLAKIYVLNPLTEEDWVNKTLFWIKEHLDWIIYVLIHLKAQKEALQNNVSPLENELLQRNFGNLLNKIKRN